MPSDDKTAMHIGRRKPLVSTLVGIGIALLVGCGPGSEGQDRVPDRTSGQTTTDQTTIQEALRFGGVALPQGAKVLGVKHFSAIDEMYVLAIDAPPGSVDSLLANSNFTTPLTPGKPVHEKAIDGFDPDHGTNIASGRDQLPPGEGRKSVVNRKVLVDRSDAARPIVHWWLFTT